MNKKLFVIKDFGKVIDMSEKKKKNDESNI